MIYTIKCTCGGETGYEFDPKTKTVECISCGAIIGTMNGQPLAAPPESPVEEVDMLKVE